MKTGRSSASETEILFISRTTSQEDMESKYERIVSSSLQAFKKLVFMLPSDSVRDAVLVYMIKLLDSPNFWKHSKSTVPQVGMYRHLGCYNTTNFSHFIQV